MEHTTHKRTRQKLKGGDEYDATSKWLKRCMRHKAGLRHGIKKRMARRRRHKEKQELKKEN